MYLTEQQRKDAIAACDGIQKAIEKQTVAWENILRIFDNLAKGKDPNDGVKPFPSA